MVDVLDEVDELESTVLEGTKCEDDEGDILDHREDSGTHVDEELQEDEGSHVEDDVHSLEDEDELADELVGITELDEEVGIELELLKIELDSTLELRLDCTISELELELEDESDTELDVEGVNVELDDGKMEENEVVELTTELEVAEKRDDEDEILEVVVALLEVVKSGELGTSVVGPLFVVVVG